MSMRCMLALWACLLGAGCERAPSRDLPVASAEEKPASAPAPSAVATAPKVATAPGPSLALTFDSDAVGGPAKDVEPVIGDWLIAEKEGSRGLLVDGSRWRSGTPSANLADQAKRLYGERYAEFLDGVKAFAFFPLAVVETSPPVGDLKMSVRFLPLSGKIDQAAGIAFGIQPDGSYLCVRANALEDNILWARVVRGKRTILDTVRNTPTATKTWHTLIVTVRGLELDVELDGTHRFHTKLDKPPAGRVGLWSKADSVVLFDDFKVEKL